MSDNEAWKDVCLDLQGERQERKQVDGWSSHGKGHLEGQEGAERAMGWERHPQVSMEDGKRKPLMEVGSLG